MASCHAEIACPLGSIREVGGFQDLFPDIFPLRFGMTLTLEASGRNLLVNFRSAGAGAKLLLCTLKLFVAQFLCL